jgi:hypothetical protein
MRTTEPEPVDVTPSTTFRLQEPDVVLEAFADETIAVNLASGRYYSLDLMAAEILDLLMSRRDLGAVVEYLAFRYDAEPTEVEAAVERFVRLLLDEGLVTIAPGADSDGAFPAPSTAGVPFAAPQLAVYSDMEDLLLLDPIHDVDHTGWPVRADATKSGPDERLVE